VSEQGDAVVGPPAPRRVLVTGAAGLIGRAVVGELAVRDVAVTALTLEDPGDLPVDRIVVGDAADPATVRDGLDGVDAVVHLAARPSPNHGTAIEVFSGNTGATFNVLEEAGRAGVRRAVIASSYSILGLPWAARRKHPAFLPLDETSPPQIEDPYGLSKLVDETTARVMSDRHGMDIVALRFPFIANTERRVARLVQTIDDPGSAAADCWTYLDVRDAATATWLSLTAPLSGFHAVFVAAPQILAPYPTEDLIAAYHPTSTLRRPIPGREVPIDLTAARRLLGFSAQHVVDLDIRPLPAGV
jgi:nucleoside-diphosphate-sugar epimerase